MADFEITGPLFPAETYPDPEPVVTPTAPIAPPNPGTAARVTTALSSTADERRAMLAQTAEAKKSALGGTDYDRVAVAKQNQNNLFTRNQFLLDSATMAPDELILKYGPNALNEQGKMLGADNRLAQDQSVERSGSQIIGDTANSVVQGLGNSVGGIAALGAGLVSDRAGNAIAGALESANKYAQSKQSDVLNTSRRIESVADDLASEDNKEAYEREKETDGPAIAGLKRVGRDFVDSADRILSDPTQFGDVAAQGIGSLAAAGPVGKALTVTGKLAGIGEKILEKGSTLLAIGGMESGGNYTQAQQEIMAMPFSELEKNSDYYRRLVASGETPENARIVVANKGGLETAAVTFPAAIAAGKLVAPFERAPFKPNSVSAALSNVLKEGVEETSQGITGQLAVNQGKTVANENQDLLEGVGTNAAQSLAGGIASAGVVQAPGTALKTIADGIRAGTKAVLDAGDRVIEQNKKASPAAPEKIEAEVNTAIESAPALVESLAQAAKPSSPEKAQEADSFLNRIASTAQISEDEFRSLPQAAQDKLEGGTTSRFEALIAAAVTAADQSASTDDRITSGLFVMDQLAENEALFNQELPEALKGLKEDSPEYQMLNDYKTILDQINQHPGIQQALTEIREAIPAMQEVAPENINQQTVVNSVGAAIHNPRMVNPETADHILNMADAGQYDLSPAERAAIIGASSLVRTARDVGAELAAMQPKGKSVEQVTDDILNKSLDASQLSLNDHLAGITQAYTTGQGKLARDRLVDLMQFARHMQNKVAAVNNSFKNNGSKETYQSRNPVTRKFETSKQAIQIHARKEGSVKLAQQIYADAKAVTLVANSVARSIPEMGVREIPIVSLAQQLRAPFSNQVNQVQAPTEQAQESVSEPVARTEPSVQESFVEPSNVETEQAPVNEINDVPVREEAKRKVGEETSEKVQEQSPEEGAARRAAERTEVEPAESVSEVEPQETAQSVETLYPDLVKVEGKKNIFHETFKIAKDRGSRLVGLATPLSDLENALSSRSSLTSFMGKAPRYDYTPEIARAYKQYMEAVAPVYRGMAKRLKTVLEKKTGKNKNTILDQIGEGVNATTFLSLRALNIVDGKNKRYDVHLIQQAIAAGLHFALNGDKTTYPLTAQQIAEDFGISESEVTEDMVRDLNRGISLTDAKRTLGDLITQFWGVVPNSKSPLGYTKGIPEVIAAEVLFGLQNAGLVQLGDVEIDGKKQVRVYFDTRSKELNELVDALSQAPTAIADAVLAVNPDDPTIGVAPSDVPETQMRNPLVKNTPQQKEAIRAAQNTPFYPNMAMISFLQSMKEQDFVEFMGGMNTSKAQLNENHKKSIEGKNLTLANSYRNLMRQFNQTQNYADAAGVDPAEMPNYYRHNVSRVGRLHMLGSSNPQADKVAREVFMSTVSQLDLTKPEDLNKFWMTIAQAIGIKTEQKTRAVAVAEAQAQFAAGGRLENALNAVVEHVQNGGDLKKNVLDTIKNAFGKDHSMKAVHALLSVARMQTSDESQKKEFTHFLSLEADGKTDGPVNALVHFTAGEFTPTWIKNVGKGGLYFGVSGKTLNSHYAVDSADLYQETTNVFRQIQAQFRNNLDPEMAAQSNALLRVMHHLSNGDVQFTNDTDLELKRGTAKNPLTITIYGSGIDGIAGKVASNLVDNLYEQISNLMQSGQKLDSQLVKDLETLINSYPVKKGSSLGSRNQWKNLPNQNGYSTLTLDKSDFDNLKGNVRWLFVNQLDEAIKTVMTGSLDTTQTVQKAVQVQSIVLKHLFNQMVEKRLKEKGLKKDEFLSQDDLNKIYKDLQQYSPFIETGTQSFLVGGKDRTDLTSATFGRALEAGDTYEDVNTPASVFGPQNAGVGGIPYMVIGTGDGQMVQNIITDRNAPQGALYVFDGVEMKASTIDEDSYKINKGVFDGWMMNPVGSVADSYRAFLRQNPVELMDDAGKKELKEALYGNTGSATSDEQMIEDINRLNENLTRDAASIEARHRVMERVELSVDHMASAEAPYSNDGSSLPSNEDQMIQMLNDMYREELHKIQDKKTKYVIQLGSIEFQESIRNITSVDPDSGARVVSAGDIADVRFDADIDPQHSEMLRETSRILKDSGYQVVLGSPNELAVYEQNNHPETYNPDEPMGYGKINTLTKTIYVSNIAPETIVHEMIHAATLDKVQAYYADPASLSNEDADAIKRLDGLMREWIEQSYENEDAVAFDARNIAMNTIARYLSQGKTALALNEFMAWSLTNKAISDVQKKTRVQNPVFKILGKALAAIKSLIWKGNGPKVDDTLYSNLRFNTRILLATPMRASQKFANVVLHQSPVFGEDQRLTDLRKAFYDRFTALLENAPEEQKLLQNAKILRAKAVAERTSKVFLSRFNMNMQQASTFKMIRAVLATEAEVNTTSLARMQEIYAHVMDKLDYTDFMRDPNSSNQTDEAVAREKLRALQGVYDFEHDGQDRSFLLPSFLALAMVDDSFREILSKIPVPKAERSNLESTTDRILTDLGMDAMDNLAVLTSGEGRNAASVKDALDNLTTSLVENVDDQQTFIEQHVNGTLNKFENYVAENMQTLSGKIAEKAAEVRDSTNNKYVKSAAQITRLMTGIVNSEIAEAIADGVTSGLNQSGVWIPVREFFNELIGRTRENAGVFDLISKVRTMVQQTRQQFREQLPNTIGQQFSRDLTDQEWSDLYRGMGKTEFSILSDSYNYEELANLLNDDSSLSNEILVLESQLKSLHKTVSGQILRSVDKLARFLNSGEVSNDLHRNAFAIFRNATKSGKTENGRSIEDKSVEVIDRLTTLKAVQLLDEPTKKSLQSLFSSERNGVEFVLAYLNGQRKDEQARLTTNFAKMNHYKGYIPSENQLGTSLIVANDSEYAKLVELGYEKVGTYEGSKAEGRGVKRSYYYSSVSGRASFNQGVLQTVRHTASGIDPLTGQTVHALTAGAITDPQEVARITANISKNVNTKEPLMPIFDEDGKVVAYERSVDPVHLALSNPNTHLGQMIGAWRGRQVEEAMATEFNNQLIEALGEVWNEGKATRSGEFIDLANLKRSDDPVLHDAWKLVGKEARDKIQEVFGGDGFRIRKDMLNDAVGFRSASVGDAWTGTTRWKPSVQDAFRRAAMGVFGIVDKGNDAYKYLVQGEKFIQNAVSSAKVLIVVKSVFVPMGNMISNIYQLSMRGVPVRHILSGLAKKTAETNQYIKNRDRYITLEADLRVAEARKDARAIQKIRTEMQSINDSNKRMSIWKLIEAGEFSSISEGGVTQEDLALSNGKFVDYMESLAERLPAPVQTLGRYALVTKNTALFKGLARATQYGDFLAKAILYDDLTKRKKVASEDAIAKISEEFVNYSRLAGRTRNYLESMGLLWFWNFKIRTMKVAASMIRENPLRALLSMLSPGLPVVGDIGSPLSDNILSVGLDGGLGYSVGPGQGLNSFNLNPWMNLMK